MSNIIHLLPDHIANQIAAGEVIQRPASVVKELVENAIDAGATQIKVIIKEAGKTLIQIIDNGSGMNESDALLCFERHATSKVKDADDLFKLTTKGFRGEALASIAAIAHVTLNTKQATSDTGNMIRIEGSKVVAQEEVLCANGSSFEIKNLFYNVPARRNFLKSDHVEFNHIRDEFERIAIPHPEIGFQLIHNDQEIYHLLPGNQRKRIVDILGKNSNDKLVPIEEKTDIVTISGFVGKPEFAKRTRGDQYFFVNHRFFKDTYFNHAVNKAFEGLILDKCFPTYFLFLTINPEKIDVNVHPTKTEIKFEEDRLIYSILFSTIRLSLGKYNIAPTLDFEQESSFNLPYGMEKNPIIEPTIQVNQQYNPFHSTTSNAFSGVSRQENKSLNAQGFGQQSYSTEDWNNFYPIEEEVEEAKTASIEFEDLQEKKRYLIKSPYIITNSKSGLLVIHIKRTLERIVYDQLMESFLKHPIDSQTLLFPIEKPISKSALSHWVNNQTLLKQLGFEFESTPEAINLLAVPSIIDENGIHDCFDAINESLLIDQLEKGDVAHQIILQIAKSVGNQKKIAQETDAEALIEQLFNCENHLFSPSQKKIMENISMDDIALKF